MKRSVGIVFIVVALLLLISGFMPKRSKSEFDVASFKNLPVLEGGRFKPLDSVARNSLLLLRGKQTALDGNGEKVPAAQWLMELLLQPEKAAGYQVFLINHQELKKLIEVNDAQRKHFSFNEIVPHIQKIHEKVQSVPQESARQDAMQRELLKLYQNIGLYHQLRLSLRPPVLQSSVEAEYEQYLQLMRKATQLVHGDPNASNTMTDNPEFAKFASYARTFGQLSEDRSMKFDPVGGKVEEGTWFNLSESLLHAIESNSIPEVTLLYAQLADALGSGDVETFDHVLQSLSSAYDSSGDYPSGKVRAESIFNQLQPFSLSMTLYVWAFIGVLLGWLLLDERTIKYVFWVVVIAFIIHSSGLLSRMIIQGRPPVTNLYSSAIFVGWGAVFLGVILERIFRNGLGAAVSSMIGFLSLIVANHLMETGDTMEMMRAVLDNNFWLATHVVTVSLGYSATYLAGFLGFFYILLGALTPILDTKLKTAFTRMVYGIVCFSLFFSFIGTVLGGIWADQSWGRFWGWDPKENGALMIVIWNALILHAKRGGMVNNLGLMNLALFGNVVTSWSWFGTNMLGVGLHSYGFMTSAFFWLSTFCLLHIAVIAFTYFYPESKWRTAKNTE